jgi:hypothetical protein
MEFLRRLLKGRYVGLLEADVARLRAENRALTNSLLGDGGISPGRILRSAEAATIAATAQAKLAADPSVARKWSCAG